MPNLKNKDQHQPKKIRRDIQALRAFAVMSVVLYHLWPERLVGGFTGVDIFFVISGYLMTTSIMGRLTPLVESQNVNPKSVFHLLTEFYARRIKRLVPAALATLLGVLALVALSGNLNVLLTNAKNIVSAATLWQNWLLASDSLNYLQQDNLTVATQHFWSLSLEEQFYLMWPLALVISTLVTLNIIVLFKRQKIPGAILPITLITLLSFAYGAWLTKTDPTIAYYSTPARVWELMIGGIIAFLPVIRNYDLKLLLPHAGLVICLCSIFLIGTDGFPGWLALLPTIGTALIIWAGAERSESSLSFDNLFRWSPIQWTGNASYSIYLWHFPLIVLLPIILHLDINSGHGRLFKICIIIATLIIAYLSYRYIEQSSQKLRIKTRHIYALFVISTGFVVGLSFFAQHTASRSIQTSLKTLHIAALDESNICFGARAVLHQDECGNPYGKGDFKLMSIAPPDNMIYSLRKDGYCKYLTTSGNKPTFVNNFCIYGDKSSKQTIILLGDSHARQYSNSFDYVGVRNHIKIILLDSIGCRGHDITTTSTFCEQRYEAYKQILAHYKKSPIIVSVLYINSNFVKQHVDFVSKHSKGKIYLLKDNPRMTPKQYRTCTTIYVSCTLEQTEALKQNNKIMQELVEQRVVSKDRILNLDRAFCDRRLCYASIGGVPVFHDAKTDAPYNNVYNTHLSATYSYSLGPFLDKKLDDMGIINNEP